MKLCDYGCGKEARYQLKNGKWCCSENLRSCSQMRENKKQTFMKKYGVENPFQSKEVQEKIKQTCLRKYGVDHNFKSKEIREKIKQTFIEKYGVENPTQSKEIQEKRNQTWLKNYGGHPIQSKEVQEKMKQTNLKNLGVEYPAQSKEVQEKRKHIFIEKYGAEHYQQSLEVKEKLLECHPFFRQVEEIKIEDNMFKVHCKNRNCAHSKEKRGWFTPTIRQIHNRITALEGKSGNDGCFFYCSENCRTTCLAFNVHGDPERDTQLPYTQEQYQTFKLHVLTRDKYICQFCGAPATHVHHERPKKLEPFFSLDPDFGWACCEKCHYAKGHKKGTECSTGNLAAKVCG
jgi:5-methylcytosine-specific restriction endonuclease McrA